MAAPLFEWLSSFCLLGIYVSPCMLQLERGIGEAFIVGAFVGRCFCLFMTSYMVLDEYSEERTSARISRWYPNTNSQW